MNLIIKKMVILSCVLGLSFLLGNTGKLYAVEYFQTDVSSAREGCTLVGVYGSFKTDIDAALKRMNEIRLEACKNGYPDPKNPKRKLSMSDYSEIKWSKELEYMARIRAAEGSVYHTHERPNGKSCFTVKSPNNVFASSEVLAWSGNTMVSSINSWYSEKNTWIKQGSGVTGHYTSMIDPDNRYVGLAMFNGCGAGRFSTEKNLDETKGSAVNGCVQIIEVKSSYLGALSVGLMNAGEIKPGTRALMALTYKTNGIQGGKVISLAKANWKSSNTAVGTIQAGTGAFKVKKYGKTKVTAIASGKTYSKTIEIKPSFDTTFLFRCAGGFGSVKGYWYKASSKTTGFQLQGATKKNFKGAKSKFIKGYKKTSGTVKGLKRAKNYYVRVRTYRQINGTKYYGKWSNVLHLRFR